MNCFLCGCKQQTIMSTCPVFVGAHNDKNKNFVRLPKYICNECDEAIREGKGESRIEINKGE